MHSDNLIKYTIVVSILAATVSFFYIKLTGKDDKDLHKQVFRVFVLVFLCNLIVHYFMNQGKDKILTEPFFP